MTSARSIEHESHTLLVSRCAGQDPVCSVCYDTKEGERAIAGMGARSVHARPLCSTPVPNIGGFQGLDTVRISSADLRLKSIPCSLSWCVYHGVCLSWCSAYSSHRYRSPGPNVLRHSAKQHVLGSGIPTRDVPLTRVAVLRTVVILLYLVQSQHTLVYQDTLVPL